MDADVFEALLHDTRSSVFERPVSNTEIGANVAWFSGSRANNIVIFTNQLKGARPWDDPQNTGRMVYDENGYPTAVPDGFVVSQLLIRSQDVAGIAPHTGRFRLYGIGTGVFSLISSSQGTLASRVKSSLLPREDIDGVSHWYVDVDFEVGAEEIAQLRMRIHGLQPGAHLRSMALVHHSHLDAFAAGEVFAPELVQDLDDYGTLRLMDWMRANRIEEDGNGWGKEGSNWTSPNPEQRYVGPDFYTFNNHAGGAKNEGRFEVSVPIRHVVELANVTGADPWIALPVDITDARAAQLGRYVAANLDPGLVARWEYGNELFNDARGFEGYRYSVRMAEATFDNFDAVGPWAAVEWAAYRGPQLYEIIEGQFQQADRDARYVAPGWAFSGSLKRDGSLTDGYLVRYFRAAQAQAMQDGTPLPLDLVTDYSVAMYFGGTLANRRPDAGVARHVLETVEGAEAQAQKLADWLLFGAGPDPVVSLTPDHVSVPHAPVRWSEALDIAVTDLVFSDITAGLDPLRDLEKVLRLNGRALQYKGAHAARWTDVLVFENTPDRTLAQMIDATQVMGYGGRLFGQVYHGTRSGLALSTDFRLNAHADYADALGLNFVAYEGGSHVAYPVEGGFEMYEAFNTGSAGARVFARWLEIMNEKGLDEYMHFMSHNRTSGNDWWGVKAYVGQDEAASAEALVLRGAIDAYDPGVEIGRTGPLRAAEAIGTSKTGALRVDLPVRWAPKGGWEVLADGTAQEAEGTNDQLRLATPMPVTGDGPFRFSFDVGLSGAKTTALRFVARATGDNVKELVRWQGDVTDGDRLSFDLDGLSARHRAVIIAVQRVGRDRSGQLTLRNADLNAQGQ